MDNADNNVDAVDESVQLNRKQQLGILHADMMRILHEDLLRANEHPLRSKFFR